MYVDFWYCIATRRYIIAASLRTEIALFLLELEVYTCCTQSTFLLLFRLDIWPPSATAAAASAALATLS